MLSASTWVMGHSFLLEIGSDAIAVQESPNDLYIGRRLSSWGQVQNADFISIDFYFCSRVELAFC
jgi:hypothetical protein